MDSRKVKQRLFLVTLTGTLLIPYARAYADDAVGDADLKVPSVGIEAVIDAYQTSGTEVTADEYLSKEYKGEYWNMAFVDVDEDSFLYIRSEETKESDWVGKLYPGAAAEIVGPVGEWTKVQSDQVVGYVKTEFIMVGDQAEEHAQQLAIEDGDQSGGFSTAVSREQEESQEQSAVATQTVPPEPSQPVSAELVATSNGQAVVDYACQFIGNPYVWGGTSLTDGADCSGFVQSVYANFGVSMPRTSAEMRSAGTEVAYENAQPGDVICYSGHVGIYIGNGQIVNAIDQAHGIGISNAIFTTILSVRRMI